MRRFSFGKNLDHSQVLNELAPSGVASYRFFFFVTISAGIAMLGMLLNSSVVVLGAMLLSPLMGPIVVQGFCLGTVNLPLLSQSSLCIGLGVLAAIGVSAAIVLLSPLSDITPEILSRTNPNLFDLVIAIMSGIAAGYVFVHKKGTELVGAALATSLMPPLAAIGFGISTWNLWIAKGAFLLFMTNMLAISIAIYGMSKLYGFRNRGEKRINIFHLFVAISILAVLSIPLTISLKNIVYQSYVAKVCKAMIQEEFQGPNFRLSDFDIAFTSDEVRITAVVITKRYRPKAKQELQGKLKKLISRPLAFTLTQVALVPGERQPDPLANLKSTTDLGVLKNYSLGKNMPKEDSLKARLNQETEIDFQDINVNSENSVVTLDVSQNQSGSIMFFHEEEQKLSKLFPKWTIVVIPPKHSLRPFFFSLTEPLLNEEQRNQARLVIWALKRWQVSDVEIVLYRDESSILKDDPILKEQYQALSALFASEGFKVSVVTQLSSPSLKKGSQNAEVFQRIDVIPVSIAEES